MCTLQSVEEPNRIQCPFLWNMNSLLNRWDKKLRVACSFCHPLLIFRLGRVVRYLRLGGMSVITFVVCPSTQLQYLHMENWGWTSSYPSAWVSGSQSFPTFGKACQCCSAQSRICLDSTLSPRLVWKLLWWLGGWWDGPDSSQSLIHQQWIGLVSSCLNSCPTLLLTGCLGSFISLKSLLMPLQFLRKSEGLAGTSL